MVFHKHAHAYIYQNTVILVVLMRILDFSTYLGVLMRIPYLGFS